MDVAQDQRTIRCLVGEVGTGPERETEAITRAFRDAGFEVVYAGHQTGASEVVQATVQEDVDVLGLAVAGDDVLTEILAGLTEYGVLADTLVLVDGAGADADREGVDRVVGPETSMDELVRYVREQG